MNKIPLNCSSVHKKSIFSSPFGACAKHLFSSNRIKSAATKKIMWSHIQKVSFLKSSVNRSIVHPHASFMRAFYCHSMLRLCRFLRHSVLWKNKEIVEYQKNIFFFIYSVDFWVMRNWNSFLLISIIWLFSFLDRNILFGLLGKQQVWLLCELFWVEEWRSSFMRLVLFYGCLKDIFKFCGKYSEYDSWFNYVDKVEF